MNRSIASLALSALTMAATGGAFAQSSVTIYGLMDSGVDRVSSGDAHVTRLISGGSLGSRLGFRHGHSAGDFGRFQ